MKFTYDLIKKNLKTYLEVKEALPILSTSTNTMLIKLGFADFLDFGNFLNNLDKLNFSLIMSNMTWRRLKIILIENTENKRFQKYIQNRTQKEFNQILATPELYDRLLNGRWIQKPTYKNKNRGRRANERFDGLEKCIVPILNYVIQNNVDVYDAHDMITRSFANQLPTFKAIKWFIMKELPSLSNLYNREINDSDGLIESLIGEMEEYQIDYSHINIDYVIDKLSTFIGKKMLISDRTRVRCIEDIKDSFSNKIATKVMIILPDGIIIDILKMWH